MDLITIFQSLLRWGSLALVGGVAVLFLLMGAYLIYKRRFRGEKSVDKQQAICAGLLCGWLILVLGLTTWSRGSNFAGAFNMDFLSGYISAWNHWSVSELQLILFNILMFAPLGFLLPLLWKKAEQLWVTLVVSFGLTALIEVFQFLTGTGIFELDDLFHNLIGSLFGYFCVMALLTCIRERTIQWAPVVRALAIPCGTGLILGGVFYAYARQPYGNMSILPAVSQDMSAVQIVTEWEPSDQNATAAVYRNKFALDKGYLEAIKSGLEELEGLTFSRFARREDENLGYSGTNGKGDDCRLLFFFRTGEWNYTTFADATPQLTEETAQQMRARYETWMKERGLLPENAVFSVQNGNTLRWDVQADSDLPAQPESFQKGSVMIQLDESGALADFFYQITWNEYAANEKVISEREAYAQVQAGNFEQYVPFHPEDTLHVTECSLEYVYDTKGYYQPVYEFAGYVNDKENPWVCQIPALAGED